jgi:hypothetical protein
MSVNNECPKVKKEGKGQSDKLAANESRYKSQFKLDHNGIEAGPWSKTRDQKKAHIRDHKSQRRFETAL